MIRNPFTKEAVTAAFKVEATKDALSFAQVLDEELFEITKLRERVPEYKQEFKGDTPFQKAHNAELLGLAFSGGGIRSATFNLGVLQALSKMNMLSCFDFLSTVSGGGYIGGWLAAWISRSKGGIKQVEKFLDPSLSPDHSEVRPITFLREYSNYLTPRLGLLGVDTWTMISIWIRNSFLNLLILASAGAALLLIPILLFGIFDVLQAHAAHRELVVATILPFFFSGLFVALNLKWFGKKPRTVFYTQPKWIRRLIVLPTFVSVFALSAIFWHYVRLGSDFTIRVCALVGMFLFFYLLLIQLFGGFYECFKLNISPKISPFHKSVNQFGAMLLFLLYPLVAGFMVGSSLMLAFARVISNMSAEAGEWAAMSWGALILLIVISAVVTIHVGLMGRNLPDDRREWWGRLSAWFSIYGIGCAALVCISVYGPSLVSMLTTLRYGKAGFLLTWLGTTCTGVLAGRSSAIGPKAPSETTTLTKILRLFLKIAPIVFVVGLLLILSKLVQKTLLNLASGSYWEKLHGIVPSWIEFDAHVKLSASYWEKLHGIVNSSIVFHTHSLGLSLPFLALVVCSLVAIGLSKTVDINEFSMHHFYKNRLVRCYLGASRADVRQANPTTGFDASDDQTLASLRLRNQSEADQNKETYDGPLPIINATLNLVHGDNLAWQQRKAASFFGLLSFQVLNFSLVRKACQRTLAGTLRPTHFAQPKIMRIQMQESILGQLWQFPVRQRTLKWVFTRPPQPHFS